MKEYKFYKLNWLHYWTLAPLILFGCLIIIPIVMGFAYNNTNLSIFGLIVFAITIFPLINNYFAKITINDMGITYCSLFKKHVINWNNIKTLGVYLKTTRSNEEITNSKDFYKPYFCKQKYIFISAKTKYFPYPYSPKITDDFIEVQWRKETFRIINNHLHFLGNTAAHII